MVADKINVIPFAAMMGISFKSKPYKSHSNTPIVNKLYMTSDIPSVFFSLMVLIACGRKDSVVKTAATYPNTGMNPCIFTPTTFAKRALQ